MPISQQEIRDRALDFSKEWADASRENAEAQTFWNEFFNVFGITRRRVASFEEPVKLDNKQGSIDLLWKKTLLVEHKSKGKSLDKAKGQAFDYFPGLKEDDLPKYVLVSDFATFRLYDLDADNFSEFALSELPNNIHLFGFISGYTKRIYKDQDPVNIEVAEKMGQLHDALLDSGYSGHKLEAYLVRLVYCLFADDTGIFPKDHFQFFLEERTRENGADTGSIISTIFQVLDQPEEKRQVTLDEEMKQFPYVNGDLFAETLPIPAFNSKMRQVLLECCGYNWRLISPAIFGSLFQSVMDQEERHSLGAHYTSEKNILKAVRGLFLDDLLTEFEGLKNSRQKLNDFHERIARLRFFDPACGCGNFLIITYREMRRLEIEILKQVRKLSRSGNQLVTDVEIISKIDVDALYGIEVEEFPARIAEVAIWLTDHQMNMELSAEFGQTFVRLPLRKSANIRNENALRINWETVVFHPLPGDANFLYILGNPPFVAKHSRTESQTADMQFACGELPNCGTLDYVCAWYVKATQFIKDTQAKVAFVSTNSITQGEQVAALWSYLMQQGVKIHFAHRTFKWSNEARGKAAVYCVIIGFGTFDIPIKRLYHYETPIAEPSEIDAQNINPYLVDFDDLIMTSRRQPIGNAPLISYGSMPNDDGFLILSDVEKRDLLASEPQAKKFVRPLLGSHEFINGETRWCLWLESASPALLRSMPEVLLRVENVKKHRLKSKRPETQRLADYPALFGEIRQPTDSYVLIPLHSSETRKYVPMGFFTPDYIVHNSCSALPHATLYHFGILTSAMHMAWMRQVCGRLESRYRYSNSIVYNNFPWPEAPSSAQMQRISTAAQKVLDARKQFPDSTLADLYDPNVTPKLLLEAHKSLDSAVDDCYRGTAFKTELERLEFLFDLYKKYAEPLLRAMEDDKKKPRRKRVSRK